MSEPAILALDIGTSSVRSALFDEGARLISGSRASQRYRVRHIAEHGAELDPATLPRTTTLPSSDALLPDERICAGHRRLWVLSQPARARSRRPSAHPHLHLGRCRGHEGRRPAAHPIERAEHPATYRLHAPGLPLAGQGPGCAAPSRILSAVSSAGSRPRSGFLRKFLRRAVAVIPWPTAPGSTISRDAIGMSRCCAFLA
jgi:hypothetical protein